MAGSPGFKVYRGKEYVAACKYVGDAAAIAAAYGHDVEIREGHSPKMVVWSEGNEEQPASESYDFVAETAMRRMEGFRLEDKRRMEALRSASR